MSRIQLIKDAYKGETIYILGAGKQMDMYNPEFFHNKVTIGVNWVFQFFPCKYTIARHLCVIREWHNKDGSPYPISTLVYPEITCDFDGIPSPQVEGYRFTDELRQNGSTTITAIDLAVYMGADRIVILGCEGYGPYFDGYPTGETNQTWLSKSRFEIEQFIAFVESKGIRVDWVRFIP